MKRASRVIAQAVASSSSQTLALPSRQLLRRPSVLTPLRPLTSLPRSSASTASSSISNDPYLSLGSSSSQIVGSRRSYSTSPGGSSVDKVDDSQSLSSIVTEQVRVMGLSGKRPPEIPDNVEIPPNVRFEGWESVVEPIPRGVRLYSKPDNPLDPITHPLSSLALPSPTDPIPESADPASPGEIALPSHVFGLPLRRDILHRCVVWYLALLRQGNQSTKDRGTVAYSGRKLRPQKGTGRARVGDASSGTRRGGAPIFALHPRDHTQLLPRKVRALGLATALSSKLHSGLMRIVIDLNEGNWSGTAEARRALCDGPASAASAESGVSEFMEQEEQLEPETAAAELVETSPVSEPDVDDLAVSQDALSGTGPGKVLRFGTSRDLSILFIHAPPKSLEDINRVNAFTRNVRNLSNVEVMGIDEVEVYHILKYQWCVIEAGVVEGMSGVEEYEGEEDLEEEMVGPEILLDGGLDIPPRPQAMAV